MILLSPGHIECSLITCWLMWNVSVSWIQEMGQTAEYPTQSSQDGAHSNDTGTVPALAHVGHPHDGHQTGEVAGGDHQAGHRGLNPVLPLQGGQDAADVDDHADLEDQEECVAEPEGEWTIEEATAHLEGRVKLSGSQQRESFDLDLWIDTMDAMLAPLSFQKQSLHLYEFKSVISS